MLLQCLYPVHLQRDNKALTAMLPRPVSGGYNAALTEWAKPHDEVGVAVCGVHVHVTGEVGLADKLK